MIGRLTRLFRRASTTDLQRDQEVEDEIRLHLALRAEWLVRHGMPADLAAKEAVRQFGPLDQSRARLLQAAHDRERQMRRTEYLSAVKQDTVFALRTLGRSKSWAAVAVLTFALGIGATTAVFSVVSSLLLHPVPYPGAGRVALIYQQPSEGNQTGIQVRITPSARVMRSWRENAHSFEDIEPYGTTDVVAQPPDGAVELRAARILPDFVGFAGERVLAGHLFTQEDIRSRQKVVMLGESFWRSAYGADPKAVGRTIELEDGPYLIAGVLPRSLRTPGYSSRLTDLWLPLDLGDENAGYEAVGRLRPGVERAVAMRELDSLASRSQGGQGGQQFATQVVPPGQSLPFRDSLLILAGAVLLVLFVACANVAHLLLARSLTRRQELAIRAALGAGRGRLFRQLLTESLVLAAAGCAAGVMLASLGLRALVAARPQELAELSAARIDGTTLLIAVALSVLTAVLFGVMGAVQSSQHAGNDALKSGGRSSASGSHGRLRAVLVVSEMALSTTLLVGATLLVRTVASLQSTDPGFDPSGLYAVQVNLPDARYATAPVKAAFRNELVARVRRLKGVGQVAIAGVAPAMGRSFMIGALQADGEPLPPAGVTAFIDNNAVSANFFAVSGMRFAQGTTFTDTTDAAAQVVVNEGLARRHFPGGKAVGNRIRVVYKGQGQWRTVTGVIRNAATGGLGTSNDGDILYLPAGADAPPALLVRVAPGTQLITSLRGIVHDIDQRLPPADVNSVETAIRASIAGTRFTMKLLSLFTLLALALAVVGLYGVIGYSVTQRTREIGIRVALGATRTAIARAVMTQGAILALVGVALGLAAAAGATRVIAAMLHGVSRTDPASFAIGGAVLIAAAVFACLAPMRRAVAVDPVITMRAE